MRWPWKREAKLVESQREFWSSELDRINVTFNTRITSSHIIILIGS